MTCQTVSGYFKTRSSLYVHIYISFCILLNRYIWTIDGFLIGTATPGQSTPGSSDYEGVLPTRQIFRIGTSGSDVVWCHTYDTPFRGCLAFCWVYNQNILSLTDKATIFWEWKYEQILPAFFSGGEICCFLGAICPPLKFLLCFTNIWKAWTLLYVPNYRQNSTATVLLQ